MPSGCGSGQGHLNKKVSSPLHHSICQNLNKKSGHNGKLAPLTINDMSRLLHAIRMWIKISIFEQGVAIPVSLELIIAPKQVTAIVYATIHVCLSSSTQGTTSCLHNITYLCANPRHKHSHLPIHA